LNNLERVNKTRIVDYMKKLIMTRKRKIVYEKNDVVIKKNNLNVITLDILDGYESEGFHSAIFLDAPEIMLVEYLLYISIFLQIYAEKETVLQLGVGLSSISLGVPNSKFTSYEINPTIINAIHKFIKKEHLVNNEIICDDALKIIEEAEENSYDNVFVDLFPIPNNFNIQKSIGIAKKSLIVNLGWEGSPDYVESTKILNYMKKDNKFKYLTIFNVPNDFSIIGILHNYENYVNDETRNKKILELNDSKLIGFIDTDYFEHFEGY